MRRLILLTVAAAAVATLGACGEVSRDCAHLWRDSLDSDVYVSYRCAELPEDQQPWSYWPSIG